MSLALLGWVLIIFSIALLVLLFFPPRSDTARLTFLSRLRSSGWKLGQERPGTAGTLIMAAVVFLLVAGIGAVTSYVGDPPKAIGSQLHSGSNGEMLASLKDYARSVGAEEPASAPATGELLPDVNTMIERLAARLKTTPEDIKGWRMLGWSYFNTGRYEQAAAAYAKAVELDPDSTEVKRSYEEAKAKASESGNSETAPSLQAKAVDKGDAGSSVKGNAKSQAVSQEYSAAIRSMVDGLADRLEKSPRDVEGWIRLMRSRVVLGEKEVAATAFRKALKVFKDDLAASGKIRAAATEFGLEAE